MKRKKLVAGNWKMNLSLKEAIELAKGINKDAKAFKCDVLVFPAFPFLNEVKQHAGDVIQVGAQNCCHKENGAFTGEVSAQMLVSLGIEYVLIGHSERRQFFGDDNDTLRAKMQVALKHKLKPVFCCGEPLNVREKDGQEDYVQHQLEESLFGFSAEEIADVTIAYEPVWAIGTGQNASPGQAQQMHGFIRQQLANRYGKEFAAQVRILYGGSCKPDNVKELFLGADVDGGLIGGASLNAKDFLTIIRAV